MARRIAFNRTFSSIKKDLIDYIKKYYPESYSDFTDASIGMMLVDLNAAVADSLFFNIDRAIQETTIDNAQERISLLNIARTHNLKIPVNSPSVSLIDISIEVPVEGNGPDFDYMPIILRGAQFVGNGNIFETNNDIDFSNPYSSSGTPNRIIEPIFSDENIIRAYRITKREIIYNGRTKILKKEIAPNESIPFLEIPLPDQNVLEVTDIISLEGVNYTTIPSVIEFANSENKWHEVPNLFERYVFVEKSNTAESNFISGEYIKTNKKFVTEYDDNDFLIVRFGGGIDEEVTELDQYSSDNQQLLTLLADRVNEGSLGDFPKAGTTVFIKYKVGGGVSTNVGVNTINSVNSINLIVSGPNATNNQIVRTSLRVTNPIPAIGGNNGISNEALRNIIKYNFSSQGRCVTQQDYYTQVMSMPSKFGRPYKLSIDKIDNKVTLNILGVNEDGSISDVLNSVIIDNIKNFLSKKRMINDFIVIQPAKLINIGFDFDIEAEVGINQSSLIREIISSLKAFLNNDNRSIGENINISNIEKIIDDVPGIIRVINTNAYNKTNTGYSDNIITQNDVNLETGLIDYLNFNRSIIAAKNEFLEVKNFDKDIRIRFLIN